MSPDGTATVAGPGRQRTGEPHGDAAPATPPGPATATGWSDYLAAARQLDGVRRGAAAAAGEQARSVQAAREELTVVRTRLAPQQARLRELGVPAISLLPTPPELTEAARSMAGGPAAVLAALRAARGRADAADAALAARRRLPARRPGRRGPATCWCTGRWRCWCRCSRCWCYAATGAGPASVAALVCGLPMPAVAFVAGWVGGRAAVPRPPGGAAGPDGALRRAGLPGAGGRPTSRPDLLALLAG